MIEDKDKKIEEAPEVVVPEEVEEIVGPAAPEATKGPAGKGVAVEKGKGARKSFGFIRPVVRLATRSSTAIPSIRSIGSSVLPLDLDIF